MLSDRRALGFKDVLIQPQYSEIKSRKDISLEREFIFRINHKNIRYISDTWVPVIASNMKGIGTWKTAEVLSRYKILTCLDKNTPVSQFHRYFTEKPELWGYIIPTVGLNDYSFLESLFKFGPQPFGVCMLNLDVANGYMDQFIKFVSKVKQLYDVPIMAGNVATRQGAGLLHQAGADIVKVGIGSGSVCTTRYKTGVGVPQVTAVNDVAEGWPNGPYVCSDGGCTSPGDVAKAFVAGADFVMLGGMFAGTVETGARLSGSAWGNTESYKTSEGKEVSVSVSQTLEQRVEDILGGLRSTGSYIGKDKIEDFYKAELIQVNEQTNDWFGLPN